MTESVQPAAPAKNIKVRIGLVVSNKCDKTAIVEIDRLKRHPIYKKYIHRRKRYYAHDEKNECQVGDRVRIIETRPISKLKRWRVQTILERAESAE